MIAPSPRNAPVLLGVTAAFPLGVAATAFLIATGSPLNAGMNALILLMTGMILAVWRKTVALPDGVAWFEIGGITALELAICIGCVFAGM
ncbi:MAG: hypothetical protein PHP59_03780 [Methanofollis sp.]|uniref:hypothetical protein n=1 Tax=Methanofollis sp. TaxID=2052835 RepID=UPI00260A470D|nr:hypothetical protein [Methanofollis sp.]MDD4254476.1 hypothetical protein [Methanofollis sp.]